MLAQAVTKQPTQRCGRANNQACLHSVQRVCISQDPHDCIKSLKLGDIHEGSGGFLMEAMETMTALAKGDEATMIKRKATYWHDGHARVLW